MRPLTLSLEGRGAEPPPAHAWVNMLAVDLSVVTSLYRSAPHLEEFHARMTREAEKITADYEIILVNDGSPDDALDVALDLHRRDARVRVIDLSRNFGHHRALMTGLAHARGDRVFLIDSDLEEEPELLGRFQAEMEASGADAVYGVQAQRKGRRVERWSGWLFFAIFNLLSDYPLPVNVITSRLMTRRFVASLVTHRERETILLGLCVLTGFTQVAVQVTKHSRSRSSYTLRRRIGILVNAITGFSDRPLVFIFYLGCAIVLLAATAALVLVVRRLFFGVLLQGWPSLIVSIWLLGGLTIFCLGIIGIYLSKV